MPYLGLKTLMKFRGKIAVFSIHNIFCRNFATFCLPYFFNPRNEMGGDQWKGEWM